MNAGFDNPASLPDCLTLLLSRSYIFLREMKKNQNKNLLGDRGVVLPLILLLLTGCATYPGWLPSPGPSREQVQGERNAQGSNRIQLVDVNQDVTRKLLSSRKQSLFSETFATTPHPGYTIGAGDVIEVSVWEAPPAMLFGPPESACPTWRAEQ